MTYTYENTSGWRERDVGKNGRFTSASTSGTNNRAYRHGLRHHPLYHKWLSMKGRCNNPNNKAYARYGKRGIAVCDEWQTSPEQFINWCQFAGYRRGLVLDRINNDGPYSPDNCRFVDRCTSAQNRSLLQASNASGYCGVSFKDQSKRGKRSGWRARASINGNSIKRHWLFNTPVSAALYRDAWVLAHGCLLPLNFEVFHHDQF